ncbi:hypothetical protein L208DRAFT_1310845, partial [Tricholoma matsutake]
LKIPKRREVCLSVFWRYFTFSVWVGRYSTRDERCTCLCSGDIAHSLVLGGARLQCILVSFKGPEEMTAICAPIPMLSHVFCFFGGYSVSGNSKLFSMILGSFT